MKLHQLRTLVALVETGSIRGAARVLGLTQPAVTTRIADLEQEVGAVLVHRGAFGTTLTHVGQALLAHARVIDHQVRRAEEEISQLTLQGGASLAMGVSPLAAIDLVAPALRQLQADYPEVQVRVVEGLFPRTSAELREGLVDFVVSPMPPAKQAEKAFHFQELVAYPMYVAARAGHPLRKATRLADLAQAQWIVGASTNSRRATVEEMCTEHGLPMPRILVHTDSVTQVQACIATSDLIGLLPRQLFAGWPALKIVALPITDTIRPVRMGLITRAGTKLTPMAEHFAGLLRQRAGEVAGGLASRRSRA